MLMMAIIFKENRKNYPGKSKYLFLIFEKYLKKPKQMKEEKLETQYFQFLQYVSSPLLIFFGFKEWEQEGHRMTKSLILRESKYMFCFLEKRQISLI